MSRLRLRENEREGAAPGSTSSTRAYERHLTATAAWLGRSIAHGRGGSSAYFSPALGWSRPYPETTGYLIPTLIDLGRALTTFDGEHRAIGLGHWLAALQARDGWWHGGLHPPSRSQQPSVFNTAQIIRGLVALHDVTADEHWLDAAVRAAQWLARGVGGDGLWAGRDYRASGTPSYYTYAASPMLDVALRCDDRVVRDVAEGVLHAILARRRPNGTFSRWSFAGDEPAFTHTIGYTLQGFIDSARLVDDWPTYGEPTEKALLSLVGISERRGGRIPGRLDAQWMAAARHVCLTGNLQIALCLLDWEERRGDPRLLRAAVALSDAVCNTQHLRTPIAGVRGAVAGSAPVWGRYMRLRYPNWAAKYHCDALVRLVRRIRLGGSPGEAESSRRDRCD